MTSPTRWTPSVIPSRARFSTASGAGTEEEVGAVVGEDAVYLLRHAAVVAAQAGLDVGQR